VDIVKILHLQLNVLKLFNYFKNKVVLLTLTPMSLKDFLGYKAQIEFGALVKIHLTLNLLLEAHQVDKDHK
jgi:hypothetical protein